MFEHFVITPPCKHGDVSHYESAFLFLVTLYNKLLNPSLYIDPLLILIFPIITLILIPHTLPLSILVSPKVVPFSFEEPIFAGESAQVTCLVSQGDEPLDISWKLSTPQNISDFSQLGIVTQSLGRRGSTLLIESAESRHRGNYTCVVTNNAAATWFTTTLNVHGKKTHPSLTECFPYLYFIFCLKSFIVFSLSSLICPFYIFINYFICHSIVTFVTLVTY